MVPMNERPQKSSQIVRVQYSISLTSFTFEEDISEREDTFTTDGLFFIEFRNIKNSAVPRNIKPFLVRGDVYDLRGGFRVNSWKDFVDVSSQSGVLSFVLKYSNACERMFKLAERNPGARIPFCLDVPRYCDDLCSDLLYTHDQIRAIVDYKEKKKANGVLVYNRAMNDLNLITGKKEKD